MGRTPGGLIGPGCPECQVGQGEWPGDHASGIREMKGIRFWVTGVEEAGKGAPPTYLGHFYLGR